jgi:hypothetical protein
MKKAAASIYAKSRYGKSKHGLSDFSSKMAMQIDENRASRSVHQRVPIQEVETNRETGMFRRSSVGM